jgi:hypothetical protein
VVRTRDHWLNPWPESRLFKVKTFHTLFKTSGGYGFAVSMEKRTVLEFVNHLIRSQRSIPRLAESLPWNRFLGFFKVYKFGFRY